MLIKSNIYVAETFLALSLWFDRLTTPRKTEGSKGGLQYSGLNIIFESASPLNLIGSPFLPHLLSSANTLSVRSYFSSAYRTLPAVESKT